MKRAIYFDDRERDLARRVLGFVADRLNAQISSNLSDYLDRMALRWTCDEVKALAAKFKEPVSKAKPSDKKAGAE